MYSKGIYVNFYASTTTKIISIRYQKGYDSATRRKENKQAYANQVKDFTRRNFDKYHNKEDSPQRNHFRYQNLDYRRSMSPYD